MYYCTLMARVCFLSRLIPASQRRTILLICIICRPSVFLQQRESVAGGEQTINPRSGEIDPLWQRLISSWTKQLSFAEPGVNSRFVPPPSPMTRITTQRAAINSGRVSRAAPIVPVDTSAKLKPTPFGNYSPPFFSSLAAQCSALSTFRDAALFIEH